MLLTLTANFWKFGGYTGTSVKRLPPGGIGGNNCGGFPSQIDGGKRRRLSVKPTHPTAVNMNVATGEVGRREIKPVASGHIVAEE